jgi:hypothetical protein
MNGNNKTGKRIRVAQNSDTYAIALYMILKKIGTR